MKVIKLNVETYIKKLLQNQNIHNVVVVSDGNTTHLYNFHSFGCGFAWIHGDMRRLKPFFRKQNKLLRRQFGCDVFSTEYGSVALTVAFLDYIAQKTIECVINNNISVDPEFLSNLRAYAQQDMAFKEFILEDVLKQIQDEFPNAVVLSRYD